MIERQNHRFVICLSCKRCLLIGIVFLFMVGVVSGFVVVGLGHFLTVDDSLSRVDAIVVLAQGYSRTRHAVDLFDQGYAPVVVFSDTMLRRDPNLVCSSAQMSAQSAQELGLPSDVIVIADEAQSTYDEAVNLRRLTQQRGWHSIIVVTDVFHTRRAARTFRVLMPDVTVYISAAPDDLYDPDHWWQTEEGLVAVSSEVIKLAFYWVEYGIVPF